MHFLIIFTLLLFSFSELKSTNSQWNFGKVSLENSGNPEVQKIFLQGLAALHSFEYKEALIDFREAQKIDPNFALAYWGEAMAYNQTFWRAQDYDSAKKVMEKLGETPQKRIDKAHLPLEKDLIHSLDLLYGKGTKDERDQKYNEFMEQLYDKFPNNTEVLSLYALSILGTIRPNDKSYRKEMKTAGVIDAAVGYNPSDTILNHPGILHYYIHALDDPIHAPLALKAADRYATVAPSSSHALHMPSHIYLQLGIWDKSREMNDQAYKASTFWVNERTQKLGDREYHSLYWLMYTNLQLGRYQEAKQNLNEILEIEKKDQACAIEGYLALLLARYSVATQDCSYPFSFNDLNKLGQCYISQEPPDFSYIYALGYCALLQKNYPEAESAIQKLESMKKNLENSITKEKNEDEQKIVFRISLLSIEIDELKALIELQNNDITNSLKRLENAANIEFNLPLPNGIPVPVQSAIDLYGTTLLRDKQWQKAKDIFLRSLERMPNKANAYVGLALALEGLDDYAEAKTYAKKAVDIWKNADTRFPELEEVRQLLKK